MITETYWNDSCFFENRWSVQARIVNDVDVHAMVQICWRNNWSVSCEWLLQDTLICMTNVPDFYWILCVGMSVCENACLWDTRQWEKMVQTPCYDQGCAVRTRCFDRASQLVCSVHIYVYVFAQKRTVIVQINCDDWLIIWKTFLRQINGLWLCYIRLGLLWFDFNVFSFDSKLSNH